MKIGINDYRLALDISTKIIYNTRTELSTINSTYIERMIYMLAVNYSTIRENLKAYCDKVTDDSETVIITRKNEKNVVLISLEEWNNMQKAVKNAEYLAMIDRSMNQLYSGNGHQHELIEVDDDE